MSTSSLWRRSQLAVADVLALAVLGLAAAAYAGCAPSPVDCATPISAKSSVSSVPASKELPSPDLGVVLTVQELAALQPTIFPDGRGLPKGQGFASAGATIYQKACANCHGAKGEGLTAPELIGGNGPLSAPDADKTLATYWPYASTLFDTIARSMPPAQPGHFSSDELYALCAWLLSENGLWPPERALDARGLARIRMPNRDGFTACPHYCEPVAAPVR